MTRSYLRTRGFAFLSGLIFVLIAVFGVNPSYGGLSGESDINLSYPYALNLFSSTRSIDPAELPGVAIFRGYRLYQTRHKDKKGVLWHRLRLGFFPTQRAAESKLAVMKARFPHAWIAKVTREERNVSAGLIVRPVVRIGGRARAGAKKGPGLWALTLFLSQRPVKPRDIPRLALFSKYRLYTLPYKGKAQSWYILRLGFFSSAKAAQEARAGIVGIFPQAMAARVPLSEKKLSARNIIRPGGPSRGAPIRREHVTLSKKRELSLAGMIKDAKKDMTRGKNKKAITLLSKVLKFPENKYSPSALELLGLAYERNGQGVKARSIYKEYMIFYPEGEGGRRVGQRLAGLETARDLPKKRLTRRRETRDVSELYGTLSQFYNRDASYTDIGGSVLDRSSLSTDIDVTYRRRTADYDIRSVFIGGYEYDFLDSKNSEGRVSRMYLDVLDRNRHISGRVGRQWYSTGGVLGRFDGGLLSYSGIPRVKFNFVAGFPADSSSLTSVNTDKNFFGLNMDLGTFWEHWDFNVFAINQRVDGITDRRAVGGEARYNDERGSYFSLVDYDTFFDRLNTFLFVGNWILAGNRTVNLSMDYRQSPSLSTSNALSGQNVNSISELLLTRTEDGVHALALDRTSKNWSVTLGGTSPINDKYQISGSMTVSELTGTEASGGVAKIPGTGPEYFYSVQLIANSLLLKNDLVIAGLSYSDTSASNTTTASLNSRFTIKRYWRINPRILFDYSTNNNRVGSQFRIRPTLRTEYSWKRRLHLEFEGGLEWIYDRNGDQTDYTRDYFLITGYRWDF